MKGKKQPLQLSDSPCCNAGDAFHQKVIAQVALQQAICLQTTAAWLWMQSPHGQFGEDLQVIAT